MWRFDIFILEVMKEYIYFSGKEMTLDLEPPKNDPMAVSEMWDESPNVPNTKLSIPSATSKPQNQSVDRLTDESSLTSSICSTLDSIQPPSLMNSLISMSEKPSLPNSPKVSSKLECRHTTNVMSLSGKKGQKVPEMVRRALGQVQVEDLSSSLSSCQSNLDNIKQPTDMDSSILSIASISSEIAEMNNSSDLSADKTLVLNRLLQEEDDDKTALDEVAPPTLMEEVSGAATKTLVADIDIGNTYTIDNGDHGDQSTYQDVTDIFDESQEPTLTLGSDNMADDIIDAPELPRDSSRENTPLTKRRYFNNPSTTSLAEREKEFDKLRNYKVSVPSLDELNDASMTSGYKSADTNTPKSPRNSSRQRHQEDRFKTHTITKNDLSDSSPSTPPPERKGNYSFFN